MSANPSLMADASFDALLCEVSACLDRGEPIDIERFAATTSPQHLARLRQLLPTLVAMTAWGREAEERESEADEPHGHPQPRTLGDFRILREIGRGGMGVVYEAEQISLARRVALKVLPFAAMLDERQLRRFKNEAHAAAVLKHPHIVSVHGIGCERGVHFYAMELVEGHSLAEVITALRAAAPSAADSAGVKL